MRLVISKEDDIHSFMRNHEPIKDLHIYAILLLFSEAQVFQDIRVQTTDKANTAFLSIGFSQNRETQNGAVFN